ncbi:MAG TPA: efflux transporter outer membrane subunit [Caulobacteraceae bacterium]|jgi:NodT family efflux transporter outer membrane factor (OMF) lipoprotein
MRRQQIPLKGEGRCIALALASLTLAACTVGPNYHTPATPTPPAYQEAGASPAVSAATPDLGAWWSQFHDPTLDSLVARALAGNLDVATAASKIRQAREQIVIARAPLFPQVRGDASVNNTMLSKNAGFSQLAGAFGGGGGGASGGGGGSGGSGGGGKGIGLPGTDFTTYTVGFDASWELDLFGQTRRGVEAARGRAEAQVWSLRDTEVSVAAEVAVDYLTLRAAQAQIAVAQKEVARQQQLLALVGARRQAGFATRLETSQQRTQLAAALAQIPPLQAQARAQIHALGVLTGQPPEALSAELTPAAATPGPPPAVPVGLPSELLRRRPDIRQAERNLAAATADVGVAVGALYPQINLTGSVDLISESLRTLVSANSLQTSATAALVQTIFDAGRNRANIRATREARRQAWYAYQKTVLTALQDVEDALSRYGAEQRRNAQLHASADAAGHAFATAQARYQSGLSDFINVLNTEAAVFTAQQQLAQSDGQLDQDLVSLYKALGGGWTADDNPSHAADLPDKG